MGFSENAGNVSYGKKQDNKAKYELYCFGRHMLLYPCATIHKASRFVACEIQNPHQGPMGHRENPT